MKNLIPYIAIIALLVFLFNRECTRPVPGSVSSDTVTIVKIIPGDSVPYSVEIEKKVPVPVYRDTGSTQWRNLPIDTMAILKDYFAKYGYDDTLMNDTSAFIRLMSHTWKNRLYYDSLLFQNRRVKQINTTTVINNYPDLKTKWYIGGGVNLLPESPGVSADLLIVTPKKFSVEGGYDLVNRMLTVKGFYKISFRKPRDGVNR
jgi:hypothetical protein